ncbi:DUF6977 family protein [Bacillota bacterium Meth-B3]
MTKRMYFTAQNRRPYVSEKYAEFKFEPGFALSQKRKCIKNMHKAISDTEKVGLILEVSTKSESSLGALLSAFSLEYYDSVSNNYYRLENVFQASKKFRAGGPYRELLSIMPHQAKQSTLLDGSGELVSFVGLDGEEWPISAKTAYYDWIYISTVIETLRNRSALKDELMSYKHFTDIAFNDKVSLNCQARSLAMYVGMVQSNAVDRYMRDKQSFLSLYSDEDPKDYEQTSLF